MLKRLRNFFKDETGQGMTEYIIIVAIIAIASIAIFTLFGDQVRHVVSKLGLQLGGQEDAKVEKVGNFEEEVDKKINDF